MEIKLSQSFWHRFIDEPMFFLRFEWLQTSIFWAAVLHQSKKEYIKYKVWSFKAKKGT